MPIAGGIAIFVLGAILRFTLTAVSVREINLHIRGVILMLGGVAGLLLPLLMHAARPHSNGPLATAASTLVIGR
jgi:hypothetical protein